MGFRTGSRTGSARTTVAPMRSCRISNVLLGKYQWALETRRHQSLGSSIADESDNSQLSSVEALKRFKGSREAESGDVTTANAVNV
jgi:hypothetical protein